MRSQQQTALLACSAFWQHQRCWSHCCSTSCIKKLQLAHDVSHTKHGQPTVVCCSMLCTRANARGKILGQAAKQLREIQDMAWSAGEHCTWPHMYTCCSADLFGLCFDAVIYFAYCSLYARHTALVAKTPATHPLCSVCRFKDLAVCARSSSSASSQLRMSA